MFSIIRTKTLRDLVEQARITTALCLRVERLERKMADLTAAEQDVETSETALEARVIAHEAALKSTSDTLQKEIDALKAGATDPSQTIARLEALKSKIDAFDPAAPAAPTNPAASSA